MWSQVVLLDMTTWGDIRPGNFIVAHNRSRAFLVLDVDLVREKWTYLVLWGSAGVDAIVTGRLGCKGAMLYYHIVGAA